MISGSLKIFYDFMHFKIRHTFHMSIQLKDKIWQGKERQNNTGVCNFAL